MLQKPKVKIATLNVKGLNNKSKQRNSLTLLKSYKLDIIMLQETNLENTHTRNFLKQQWGFDSYWTSKTAILTGNRNLKLENVKESHNGRVITANLICNQYSFLLNNIYAPPNTKDRIQFFNN